MSNNHDITVYDFENICRTCLSREDLKPLYEKSFPLICLADMLMACTFVKIAEDDGLPVNICCKCIHEINQAFSFAKRCEITDTILRNCVNVNTESQTIEPVIKTEIILSNLDPTDILGDNVYVQQNIKIEDLKYMEQLEQEENMQLDAKQEEELVIKNDDLAAESYEEDVDSEEFDNSGFKFRIESNKLHVCSVCSKTFTRPNNLQRHIRIHTGEKPYACATCSKSFNSNSDLTKHKRIHTGEKPYVCSVCNKAFTDSSALKSHMRMHSGEKPYSCELCSKNFSRKYNLNKHKRTHI